MHYENKVAKILFIIGCSAIAFGVISGLSVGRGYANEIIWSVFLSWFAVGFVSGMIFIGFAEVIHLLHHIRKKLYGEEERQEPPSRSDDNEESRKISWSFSAADEEKIINLYRSDYIQEVIPTPFEDYCIVKLESETGYRVVEVSGFSAIETKESIINEKIKHWHDKER